MRNLCYNLCIREIARGIIIGAQLKTTETSFIRKQNHSLTALLKMLQKERQSAVEVLVKGMASEDIKLASSCAKQVLDLEIQVAEMINKDSFTRTLAQVKLGNGLGGSTVESDSRPLIDFTTIQSTD